MAFESMKFNCISLNVRGLNKSDKRRKVFRWIHQQKAQIVFLQETFSTKDVQTKWRSEWGGQVFYSHGSNHSKGVMILINPNFNIQIQRTIHDKSGRFLILKASIEESDVVFVNVYAPNDNASQITFYKILQDRLKEFSDDNLIIAGDFNCPLSPLDKRGGKTVFKKNNVRNEIQKLISLYDLTDVWRDSYPQQLGFTWRDKALKVQTRLDYFLVSKTFKSIINKCDIMFAPLSDHSAIFLGIQTDDYQKTRGPGFWKFNSSLLRDNKYVEPLRDQISQSKLKYDNIEDKSLKWDLIKMEIRSFTIQYSKRKARAKRTEEKEILNAINTLQKELEKQPQNNVLKHQIDTLKQQLDTILQNKIKGTILRSKARWFEEGERNSKYFLNLEKRNRAQKYITKLKTSPDKVITDASEILKEEKKFYEKLYTSKNPNIDAPDFDEFFRDEHVAKLNEVQKQSCEGDLSAAECLNALKGFRSGRTPGTDGLNTEFYNFFSKELSPCMILILILSKKAGKMSISSL